MAGRGNGIDRELAGRLVVAALLIAPAIAAADDDRTPMIRRAAVGAAAHEHAFAAAIDAAWWQSRFGVSAERARMWSGDDARRIADAGPVPDVTRYGIGVALRLRGGDESDGSSLLPGSPAFARVMAVPLIEDPTLARVTTPPRDRDAAPLTISIGLGAAFGTGDPGYLARFRTEPLSAASRRRAGSWFER